MVVECREHKPQLLAFLQFEERADALLLNSTSRIAAEWPEKCHLEHDRRWLSAEAALDAAYVNLDLSALRKAIRMREQVALEVFAGFRKQQAR
jgi:hypothetical protein